MSKLNYGIFPWANPFILRHEDFITTDSRWMMRDGAVWLFERNE
jgi:hypothetical protein